MKQKPRVLNTADKYLYTKLKNKSIEMRNNPTEAEARMWKQLRNNKMGIKFRRQHLINKFIVDFYCVEKALIIEIDGDIHSLQKERDKERENVLENMGCKILRFNNKQILNDIKSVLKRIHIALKSPGPPTP